MSFIVEYFKEGTKSGQSPVVDAVAVEVPEISPSPVIEEFEQHIVSEYLDTPSVLSIRKGDTILAATDHFILGGVNEPDQERMSFVFSFGDPVLFGGMGRRPRIYSYSGFLKDSQAGGKGISGWREMYDKYLRGTKCRASGAIADLRFRDHWRLGYIIASNMGYDSAKPQIAPFSFSMFIVKSIP